MLSINSFSLINSAIFTSILNCTKESFLFPFLPLLISLNSSIIRSSLEANALMVLSTSLNSSLSIISSLLLASVNTGKIT